MSGSLSFDVVIGADGKLSPHDFRPVGSWVRDHAGQRVVVTFTEIAKPGSYNQIKYYWGVVMEAGLKALNEPGNNYTKDQLHTALKGMFAPKDGRGEIIGLSVMNMHQRAKYIDDVIWYLTTECGAYVAPPTSEVVQ